MLQRVAGIPEENHQYANQSDGQDVNKKQSNKRDKKSSQNINQPKTIVIIHQVKRAVMYHQGRKSRKREGTTVM